MNVHLRPLSLSYEHNRRVNRSTGPSNRLDWRGLSANSVSWAE
jgi:hypothetical protein